MPNLSIQGNTEQRLENYLRIHRRRIGLSQKDLGTALGYEDEAPVSRHESFQKVPPLAVALGYEILFGVPVSEIFAGLKDQVEQQIEIRLSELATGWQQRSAKERGAMTIARKLEWIAMRRNADFV
jgi:DNA-binding XRE family transcriptional regulator